MGENYQFNCPKCNKQRFYSYKGWNQVIHKNSLCKSCVKIGINIGRKFTKDHINKLSETHKGKQCGLNNGMYGKRFNHSEETKEKIRIKIIEDLKKKGITGKTRNYNPKACEYINNLNEQNGWNLQHAMNGGEIEIAGYFLDGYDHKNNIVFEYDEYKHNYTSVKKKDKIRQERIINKIKPSMFLRYDETNNILYSIINKV